MNINLINNFLICIMPLEIKLFQTILFECFLHISVSLTRIHLNLFGLETDVCYFLLFSTLLVNRLKAVRWPDVAH